MSGPWRDTPELETTGHVPGWIAQPVARPARAAARAGLLGRLTAAERYELGRRLASALRHTADEAGAMRGLPASVTAAYGTTWRDYDATAADLAGLLTDDILSVTG
jgi:hypothetical protein